MEECEGKNNKSSANIASHHSNHPRMVTLNGMGREEKVEGRKRGRESERKKKEEKKRRGGKGRRMRGNEERKRKK